MSTIRSSNATPPLTSAVRESSSPLSQDLTDSELEILINSCLRHTFPHQSIFPNDGFNNLRMHIALHGLPAGLTSHGSDGLRCKVWKLLLGVPLHFDVESYITKCDVRLLLFTSLPVSLITKSYFYYISL